MTPVSGGKCWLAIFLMSNALSWQIILLSSLKQIVGIESCSVAKESMPEFTKLVIGVLSLPINLPGTIYWKGLQARKNVVGMIRQLIEERRASIDSHQCMLDLLMRTDDIRYTKSPIIFRGGLLR